MIKELKWTKKARIAITILCIVLGTAGLLIFSQMNQIAEAAILTPIDSQTEQTTFYDEFGGDLSNWTIVGGAWTIENGELSGQTSAFGERIMIKDLDVSDFTAEYKVRFISSTYFEVGLAFRGLSGVEPKNCYWVGVRSQGLFLLERKTGASLMLGSYSFSPSLNVNYTVKVWASGQNMKVWLDGDLQVEVSNADFAHGSIGIMAWSAGSEHAHIDYANVTVATSSVPTTYSLAVRAGATQIVVTCDWSGLGNITIANITSPTRTYYESDMGIYEKTTVSFDGVTTNYFNIRRAALSIPATSSEETWILNLNLTSVTRHQVGAEVS